MKTRILSLTTMIALLLTLAACSSDEAPDNFEPRLVTGEASGVTRTEAVIAGEVMLQGSTDMPELRFRYGTTDQMDHTTGVLDPDGNKVKIQLTGLQPGTMYYYRLHGTNGRVELHGNTMTFVTMPNDRPTVGVPAVLSQGPMSVIVEYEITDDGNETITSTGCYVTDIETGDTQSVEAETPGAEGVGMRVRIGGLRQNATYEIKAYAANGEGESVGEALTITTSDAVLLADAGEFEELMGDSKYEYTTLSIAGPMNGDDLRCLRQMMGRDIDGSATAGRLAQVNMADAHIVEGGGVYGSSRYTENNVVGYGLFADCTLLTSVTLPSDAVKIEKDAFMNCTALRVTEQLADALGYIHSKQIIHRDLKPSNIMITHNGHNTKLIDFSLSDSDYFNVLKCPAGSSGYIAPEQLQPDAKPDIKADIYSFGMVVRDMARLTGDAYLRRIAAACTRRNASERPADMSAVMSLPRTDNRQRIVVALLALVVAALTAYVAVTLYNRSTASDDARQDNAPIEIAPDSNRALDYTLWPERGEK